MLVSLFEHALSFVLDMLTLLVLESQSHLTRVGRKSAELVCESDLGRKVSLHVSVRQESAARLGEKPIEGDTERIGVQSYMSDSVPAEVSSCR